MKNNKKFSEYFYNSMKVEWKDYFLDYNGIKKDILEGKKKILNKIKKEKFISYYGKNDEFTIIIDKINNKLISSIKNIEFNFQEFQKNWVNIIFKLINEYRTIDFSDTIKFNSLLINFENCLKLYLDINNFIDLNLLGVIKLLKKLDIEFKILENKLLKKIFKDNLFNNNNVIKNLAHREIIFKCFFVMKNLYYIIEKRIKYPKDDLNKLKIEEEKVLEKKKSKSINYNEKEEELKEINTFLQVNQKKLENNLPTLNFKEDSLVLMKEESINNQKLNINIDNKLNNEIFDRIGNSLNLNIDYLLHVKMDIEKLMQIKIKFNFDKEMYVKEAEKILDNKNLTEDEFFLLCNNINDSKKITKKECYRLLDLWLVLIGTFFYIFNYYGWSINSKNYLDILNFPDYLFGVVNAVTPFTAFLIVFLFNYTTKFGFKYSYFVCLFLLISGNILYLLAYYLRSLTVLLIGKGLVGLGGCRLWPRKFIAIMVKEFARTKYSAIFVGMTCVATGLGPGLVYWINLIGKSEGNPNDSFNIYSIFNNVNKFTGFMIIIWIIYSIFFIILFKDSKKIIKKEIQKSAYKELAITKIMNNLNKTKTFNEIKNYINNNTHSDLNYFYNETFLKNNDKKTNNLDIKDMNDKKTNEKVIEDSKTQNNNIFKKYFPNGSTVLISIIVLFNKMVQENFLSEISFSYKTIFLKDDKIIGFFFDALIVYSLIITMTLIYLSKIINDKKILLFSWILISISSVLKIDPFLYFKIFTENNFWYYNITSALLYISTLILEGSAISLLSKIINPSLRLGYFNSGLITGICDTLGRAIGNSFITLVQIIYKNIFPNKKETTLYTYTLQTLYLFYSISFIIFWISYLIIFKKITKFYKISLILQKKEIEFENVNK